MKTISARIAVLVTADGRWAATGSHQVPDKDVDWQWLDEMCDHENPTDHPTRVWVTVEIPLPQTLELTGTVEQ